MAISGIDAVTFGVSDMVASRRFCEDWGLKEIETTSLRLVYETKDGGRVIVRPGDDDLLAAPIEPGNTVREILWGCDDGRELDATLERIAKTCVTRTGPDGLERVDDPNGLSLAFGVSSRRSVKVVPTPTNGPGAPARLDRRSPVYERAHPVKIGHVVLFANDYQAMRTFYTEAMGFTISDEYPGHGAFLRCRTPGEHHNLFILNRPAKPGVNHVAFTVSDIHEVIGGGLAMSRCGWQTEIGPGRHPISSAYFWYFHNPLGAPVEYYADDDYCTELWRAETFQRKPELFAEWAINGGIDGVTRRQVVQSGDSDRGHT